MRERIRQYSLSRIFALITFIAAIIWTTWWGQYWHQIIVEQSVGIIFFNISLPLFVTSFILYLYSKKKTNNIRYSFNRLIIISTTISLILTIIFLPNVLSTYADYQAQRSSLSSAGTVSMAEILFGLLMCAIPFIHCYIITGILGYCKRCEQKKEKPFWRKIKPIAWMKKFLQILKT